MNLLYYRHFERGLSDTSVKTMLCSAGPLLIIPALPCDKPDLPSSQQTVLPMLMYHEIHPSEVALVHYCSTQVYIYAVYVCVWLQVQRVASMVTYSLKFIQ